MRNAADEASEGLHFFRLEQTRLERAAVGHVADNMEADLAAAMRELEAHGLVNGGSVRFFWRRWIGNGQARDRSPDYFFWRLESGEVRVRRVGVLHRAALFNHHAVRTSNRRGIQKLETTFVV